MANGNGVTLKRVSLGGVAVLLTSLGGVWVFGEKVSTYLDERTAEVCQEYDERYVEALEEDLGNITGQLGEVWMELCDLKGRIDPRYRWYRGGCIREEAP